MDETRLPRRGTARWSAGIEAEMNSDPVRDAFCFGLYAAMRAKRSDLHPGSCGIRARALSLSGRPRPESLELVARGKLVQHHVTEEYAADWTILPTSRALAEQRRLYRDAAGHAPTSTGSNPAPRLSNSMSKAGKALSHPSYGKLLASWRHYLFRPPNAPNAVGYVNTPPTSWCSGP